MIKTRLKIAVIVLIGYMTVSAYRNSNKLPDQKEEQQLPSKVVEKWELLGLKDPESVLYDEENNVLYVSNLDRTPGQIVRDGKGFISKVSPEGEFITKEWITGLNDPKGLVKYNDKLYVSDLDQVIEISIKEGRILNKYDVQDEDKDTKFYTLNDLAVDKNGDVYISYTFGSSAIYKLSNGSLSIWIKDEKLNMPNGLFIENGILYTASWGNIKGYNPRTFTTEELGGLLKISLADKKISQICSEIGNLDGLEKTDRGFYISDWFGKLKYYDSKTKKVITLADDLPEGSADIGLNRKEKIIYVPQARSNKIVAYSIE